MLVAQSCLIVHDPWTVAYQVPLSMELSRQEYWSGLPFPSLGDLPTQGSNLGLLHYRQILYFNPEILYSNYFLFSLFWSCVFHFSGLSPLYKRLPSGASGKGSVCQCRRCKRRSFDPWVEKIPWRRKWWFTLVFSPGESHGQRSLEGSSP